MRSSVFKKTVFFIGVFPKFRGIAGRIFGGKSEIRIQQPRKHKVSQFPGPHRNSQDKAPYMVRISWANGPFHQKPSDYRYPFHF